MMAERPILLFGEPATVAFGRKRGGGDKIQTPTYSEQVQRMAPKLEQLDKTLLSMQPSSEGIEPERTLVLEVAGDIESFYIAVKNMGDGVEWILDMPEQFEASDDFYVYDENKETKMRIRNDKKTDFRGKVYCVLTNAQALREMLTLWDRYSKDKNTPFPHGKAGLRDVFKHLIDIHIWGYKERLEETGILDYWQEELDSGDSSDIMCELEFFYRNSKEKREAQEQRIKNELEELGGSFVTSSIISHISYHAVLASIPRNEVKKIIEGNRSVSIVVADPIMFIRPVGQSVFIQKDNSFDATLIVPKPSDIIDEPIIALFDGVPQENHPYLTGRLVIDDPDDFTSHYTVQARKHGTSMASLIALGDLGNLVHQSLRKIYVRPIMKPTATLNDTIERIPDNELFVDKIHIAVRRLFEEEAGRIAPTIKVINLSIGLAYRQFDNTISPLARLIGSVSHIAYSLW